MRALFIFEIWKQTLSIISMLMLIFLCSFWWETTSSSMYRPKFLDIYIRWRLKSIPYLWTSSNPTRKELKKDSHLNFHLHILLFFCISLFSSINTASSCICTVRTLDICGWSYCQRNALCNHLKMVPLILIISLWMNSQLFFFRLAPISPYKCLQIYHKTGSLSVTVGVLILHSKIWCLDTVYG